MEVAAAEPAFAAFGVRTEDLFAERAAGYLDFRPEGPVVTAERLPDLAAAREKDLRAACRVWWDEHAKLIVELPDTRQLPKARSDLLGSFGAALIPLGVLDEFATGGIVASWWGDNLYDLKALAAGGFGRVIEGWATTIEAMLTPEPGPDGKLKTKPAAERRKALDHKLVPHLLPDYLADLEEAEAAYAGADAAYKAALASDLEDDEVDEEDSEPADLDELKATRSSAQKKRAALEKRFLATLNMAVASLTPDEERELVLKILDEDLASRLDARITRARQAIIDRFRTWSDKYSLSLDQLESDRWSAAIRLATHLQELGYA